jgi:serine/threonine protein kinase
MTPKISIATETPVPRYAAGDVLGNKYLLEEPLGQGGMGTVWRARNFERTEHGDFFIVMELLEGETLAGLLDRRGTLEPTECVRLVLPVVDALCAVHANGIVHRDLKPSNIMLARVGQRCGRSWWILASPSSCEPKQISS